MIKTAKLASHFHHLSWLVESMIGGVTKVGSEMKGSGLYLTKRGSDNKFLCCSKDKPDPFIRLTQADVLESIGSKLYERRVRKAWLHKTVCTLREQSVCLQKLCLRQTLVVQLLIANLARMSTVDQCHFNDGGKYMIEPHVTISTVTRSSTMYLLGAPGHTLWS